MTDRNFNVRLTSEKSLDSSKPFLREHFSAVLVFIAAIIAAIFAMSETAFKLFANQPPVASIRMGSYVFPVGEYAEARVPYSDDGEEEDLHYTWWLKDIRGVKEVQTGLGPSNSILVLKNLQPGKYELLVKLKDKQNTGKVSEERASFEVVAAASASIPVAASTPGVASGPLSPASAVAGSSVPRIDVLRLTDGKPINWNTLRASKIVTNGYELTIDADSIDEDLTVVAFEFPASAGPSGQPGALGANGGYKQGGGSGYPGSPGQKGADGVHAKPILIRVRGAINANLNVDNTGQTGGAGGKGGDGGPGGSGGQGEASRSGVFDCAAGPGYGGKGGNGGDGAVGGDGGIGGNAGLVDVKYSSRGERSAITLVRNGGMGGHAGVGGRGGAAGAGGPEGASGGRCASAGRNGQAGQAGANGQLGRPGSSGASIAG